VSCDEDKTAIKNVNGMQLLILSFLWGLL
jgi:hypothetical protein